MEPHADDEETDALSPELRGHEGGAGRQGGQERRPQRPVANGGWGSRPGSGCCRLDRCSRSGRGPSRDAAKPPSCGPGDRTAPTRRAGSVVRRRASGVPREAVHGDGVAETVEEVSRSGSSCRSPPRTEGPAARRSVGWAWPSRISWRRPGRARTSSSTPWPGDVAGADAAGCRYERPGRRVAPPAGASPAR